MTSSKEVVKVLQTPEKRADNKSKLNDGLSVGMWILIPYGYNKQKFCVLERTVDKVLLGMPSWCVSSAIWMSIDELEKTDGDFLGKGKYRWWRKILPWPNDLMFPYSANR